MNAHEGDGVLREAPQPASTAGVEETITHAGVAVLGSRMLWDRITAFMPGYPFVVHKFYQESDPAALFGQRDVDTLPIHLVGHLTGDGVLPHLAIAANDPEMLQVLFKLPRLPGYQCDRKLSFRKVMRCAVLYNSVDFLQCINQLRASNLEWQWEPCLMRIALQRDDPDFQVLDWLHAHLPPKSYSLSEKLMMHHVRKANLEVVQWLHEHKRKISQAAVDEAAKRGLTQVLSYFYEHSSKRCSLEAVNRAAWDGCVDVVKLAVENQKKATCQFAINPAARNGQLEVVKFLIESKTRLDAPHVIDYAAGNGHLEVVKYLHENYSGGGCTPQAMSDAAGFGRLDIVQFLYEHRTEGCTPDALDRAVQHGHLEVAKFLRDKYALRCSTFGMDAAATNGHLEVLQFVHGLTDTEGCSVRAMDGAAGNGHLEVVEFLHFNRAEGCTDHAMRLAGMNGHHGVVEFLCEHRSEGDVVDSLTSAVEYGHMEIVKLLHSKLQSSESAYPALEAAVRCLNTDMVQFLCENPIPGSVSILKQAVTNDAESTVLAVLQYSALEDLADAKDATHSVASPLIAVHGDQERIAVGRWRSRRSESQNRKHDAELLANSLRELLSVHRVAREEDRVRTAVRCDAERVVLDHKARALATREVLARRAGDLERLALQHERGRLPRSQRLHARTRRQVLRAVHRREHVAAVEQCSSERVEVVFVVFVAQEHRVDRWELVQLQCRSVGVLEDHSRLDLWVLAARWVEHRVGEEADAVDGQHRGGGADVRDGHGALELGWDRHRCCC